jgi:hypothetical protein
MGAKYTSQKPEYYQSNRNNIYLARECYQQECTFEHASASRNLPEMTKENYNNRMFKKVYL